jgi:hypothetical protein
MIVDNLKLLLDLLHSQGYRLRALAPDRISVVDAPGPQVQATGEQSAVVDPEEDLWAHVGGRPAGLRKPVPGAKVSYTDEEMQ